MRASVMVMGILLVLPVVHAADGDASFLFGGGAVAAGDAADPMTSYSLGIGGLFLDRWGAEVTLEGFRLDPNRNYDGLQVNALYHFRHHDRLGVTIPYVVAGVGFRSDDWTELPSYATLRLGAGLRYYPWRYLGLRVEAGDDILLAGGSPHGVPFPGRTQHILGLRAGVCLRF